MAIQAQLYNSENIGFPFCGSSSSSSYSSQDWMMLKTMMENASCGGGGVGAGGAAAAAGGFNHLYFNTQQRQQIHQLQQNQQQQQQQRNQSLFFENSSTGASMPISVHVEKQRQEIDDYIRSQNEKLRFLLQAQRKQELEMLLKKIESKAATLLRQKDEEIGRASNRAMELEILLKKLEMENQAWQRTAQEYESIVFSLNTTLEQMRETACCFFFNNGGGGGGGAEDAESCCDVEEEEVEKEKTEENRVMVCRGCNSRDSCVLFLPCRHLCSCKACDAFLDSCPVCSAPKKASIEALIS